MSLLAGAGQSVISGDAVAYTPLRGDEARGDATPTYAEAIARYNSLEAQHDKMVREMKMLDRGSRADKAKAHEMRRDGGPMDRLAAQCREAQTMIGRAEREERAAKSKASKMTNQGELFSDADTLAQAKALSAKADAIAERTRSDGSSYAGKQKLAGAARVREEKRLADLMNEYDYGLPGQLPGKLGNRSSVLRSQIETSKRLLAEGVNSYYGEDERRR